MEKLINPYELLGVDINSSISKLKKNYYNLSLITHPDKGGNDKDFHIIYLAYNYIKNQLSNKADKETTYEELEDEFQEFIKNQKEEYTPFYEIYKETNDWLNEFNKQFEQDKDTENVNIFNKGYKDIMDETKSTLEYTNIEKQKPEKIFKKEIIEYNEPSYLPNNIVHFPLDVKEIKDFSYLDSNLKMSDYKLSFQNDLNEKDLLKLNTKEFNDFPKNNIDYN